MIRFQSLDKWVKQFTGVCGSWTSVAKSLFGFIIEAHLSITYKLDLVDSTGRQEFFTNSSQYNKTNIANRVLAVPLEIK